MPHRKICQVRVRMTEGERERLSALAKASNITFTDLVHRIVEGDESGDRRDWVNVPVPAHIYPKLHQLALQSGLTAGETLSALIHEASQVRLLPGQLQAVA